MKINILCTPDNNYVPYCGIMLTSLFENNKGVDFEVYIMCERLDDNNIADFKRLAKLYHVQIKILTVNKELFKKCPVRPGDHISIAAYFRLIAPEMLPKHINKVLYIDCDIIVNASIEEFYAFNIDKNAFGAVIDEAFFNNEKYERLCYDKRYSHINSGVLLLNLDYWRENKIADKCLEYISKYPERVKFHDQDTLNAVLHKEMKLLPIKYNLQTGFLFTDYTRYYENDMPEILEATKSPVIIHFTGVSKPWFIGSRHPYRKRFMHYKNISLWKAYPLKKNRYSLYERIIKLRNEIIWGLGIMKRPKSYIIEEQA